MLYSKVGKLNRKLLVGYTDESEPRILIVQFKDKTESSNLYSYKFPEAPVSN